MEREISFPPTSFQIPSGKVLSFQRGKRERLRAPCFNQYTLPDIGSIYHKYSKIPYRLAVIFINAILSKVCPYILFCPLPSVFLRQIDFRDFINFFLHLLYFYNCRKLSLYPLLSIEHYALLYDEINIFPLQRSQKRGICTSSILLTHLSQTA